MIPEPHDGHLTFAQQFEHSLRFPLDNFQRQAVEALENDHNVLVAAPTGAGKTIIADFAVYLAHQQQTKAFYTTPIKALSNQKYHDFVALYGSEHVGILTGDTVVNPQADIIVMTTEVLRNMIYERSTTLSALQYVILDEIHFLGDQFRGAVWEEVIIHLPQSVKIIGLSATVSNVEEFGDWIRSVRGATQLVVSEHRPVPLQQHVAVHSLGKNDRTDIFDLYHTKKSKETIRQSAHQNADMIAESDHDTLQDSATTLPDATEPSSRRKLNRNLVRRIDQLTSQAYQRSAYKEDLLVRKQHKNNGKHSGRHSDSKRTVQRQFERELPTQTSVINALKHAQYLPAIYFIFSRAGCDKAVQECLRDNIRLTNSREADTIAQVCDSMVLPHVQKEDLVALGYYRFRKAAIRGIAAHHAGMITILREVVERLFSYGLLKVVFATETLALGVNMPARTVVIEKLQRYNGQGHVPLTAGEFTQLTGRAGRRGIDNQGHVVIVDHRNFSVSMLASLSSKRVYPLHSSFHPTFNMAMNLLNNSTYDEAISTLDHSFAQWETQAQAQALYQSLLAVQHKVEQQEEKLHCEYGDIVEFVELRYEISRIEKNEKKSLQRYRGKRLRHQQKAMLAEVNERIAQLRDEERQHPCRECPELHRHMSVGYRWMQDAHNRDRLQHQYNTITGTISHRFTKICDVLQATQCLSIDDHGHATISSMGKLLRYINSEQDFLIVHCLMNHVFRGLTPNEFAGVISSFVYESRMQSRQKYDKTLETRFYNSNVELSLRRIGETMDDCDDVLLDYQLEALEDLDCAVAPYISAWACGHTLAEILRNSSITPGDFVRTCKRVSDILKQIDQACSIVFEENDDYHYLIQMARTAYQMVNRGVVAYTGVDDSEEDAEELLLQ